MLLHGSNNILLFNSFNMGLIVLPWGGRVGFPGVEVPLLNAYPLFVVPRLAKLGSYQTCELELELIQTQMTQKPMLRAEVYARALRASQNRKEDSL
jgi:hypothetical protein